MSGRSKGFDPLSNLFTDAAAAPSAPAEGGSVPAAAAPEPVDPAALPPTAPPPVEAAETVDKIALAKRLAAEAQARSAAPSAADKVALAKNLAAEAQAKATPPALPPPDKAALAKALAKAALAKSGAAPKAPQAAKPQKSLAERAPRSLSERAGGGRRMSALEAARAAAADEAARKQASAKGKRPASAAAAPRTSAQSTATGLLGGVLGADIEEGAPRLAQQRELLTALWKAHTQRHVQDKRWNVAGSCAAVVDALGRLSLGELAAVPVKADAADLLVWVDLSRRSIVAVIPDGRTYLAGL